MRTVLREPLVHFLALGALLFLFFEWQGGASGAAGTRISITPGLVEHLASGFERTWQRPPTEQELKGLIDDHIKEEIATREAIAMGLDQGDTIIRRRLRQKFDFLVEDAVDQVAPTDAELQAWLENHSETFLIESRVALRHVFIDTGRRGATARADAESLLARLRAAGPDARIENLGDASMLPRELPLGPLFEVERSFGTEFAAKIDSIEPGQWTGPVESPYGLHLILVPARVAPSQPALEEIRPLVERELAADRRKAQLAALYERLLQKYTVTLEIPQDGNKGDSAAQSKSGPP